MFSRLLMLLMPRKPLKTPVEDTRPIYQLPDGCKARVTQDVYERLMYLESVEDRFDVALTNAIHRKNTMIDALRQELKHKTDLLSAVQLIEDYARSRRDGSQRTTPEDTAQAVVPIAAASSTEVGWDSKIDREV